MTRQMQLAKQGLTVIPVRNAGELQAFNSTRSTQPILMQNARSGNSLEDVLRRWSQQARIGFLWKTTQRYAVKDDVSMANGKYAESVQALLDQYNDDKVRPVGRLHVDPVTGNRTLTIVTQ
ncbi:MAG: TcpQ domain-containing protein [Bdellovibrionales bacterium]